MPLITILTVLILDRTPDIIYIGRKAAHERRGNLKKDHSKLEHDYDPNTEIPPNPKMEDRSTLEITLQRSDLLEKTLRSIFTMPPSAPRCAHDHDCEASDCGPAFSLFKHIVIDRVRACHDGLG